MLRKSCKSVIVIVCLFFFSYVDVSAQVGIVGVEMGRFVQNNDGVINVTLIEKNSNQIIVASLVNDNGVILNVAKLNNNFSTKIRWKVESGAYKVILVNTKTKEKEIHYAVL